MRILAPCLGVVAALAGTSVADKKLQQLAPGFAREAQTCATQVSGLRKVQTGSATLAATLSPDDKTALDKDLATLAAGLASVEAYCTEVTALVAFLATNADAAYRSVEKELDVRDNTVRKLRKTSKQTLALLQPITRRWIGRIAAAQAQKPDVVDPRTPGKFPSGRAVLLPPLGGAWKLSGTGANDLAEYTDKAWAATVFVRPFSGATCEQQQRALPTGTRLSEATKLPGTEDGLDTAWVALPPSTKTYIETTCVRGKSGGWIGTLEVRPAWIDAATPLRALLIRMLVAQNAPRAP